MAEFDVTIHVRMKGSEAQVNDRIDKALDRAFPAGRKDVLALSWESREDTASAPATPEHLGGER